jgi:hypothetical protein
MPGRDDDQASWLEAADSSSLPVPADVTEAVHLIGDAAAFLSAGRPAGEPHHGEDGWAQDLDAPETRSMLGYLAEIVHAAGSCLSRISDRQRVPGPAKPELDAIAGLLAGAGRKLSVLGGRLEQEAQATAPAQYAGLDFPHAPSAGPASGPGRQARPGTAAPPPARHLKP